ncbi:MAG TPA: 3D domain-containing protein [Gemmatimonadaceae bacterium]
MSARRIAWAFALAAAMGGCGEDSDGPIALEPVVVQSPLLLPGAVVQGVSSKWFLNNAPPRYGDPVPVQMTAYCLTRTTTRRGRYVRAGIVAADPRLFPLSRYVELYTDGRYLGRFLIDDTGRLIKGNIIDIWMPTCREARQFGRRKGTAVLVPRQPDPSVSKAGSPK